MILRLDGAKLTDVAAMLAAFNTAFGFKAKNRDALVDLLTHLDSGATARVLPGELVLVRIEGEGGQFGAIAELTAFVNWRRLEKGEAPLFALAAEP